MPPSHDLVILFTRYPVPGNCKTRLIPLLGSQGACDLHTQLVFNIMKVLKQTAKLRNTELVICYDGGSEKEMQEWLGAEHSFIGQRGADLGERMANAFSYFHEQKKDILLLGSDCPGVTSSLIVNGLENLKDCDMVLGPAHDGGYYLIGLSHTVDKTRSRALFQDIAWSTSTVRQKTLERAEQLKLHFQILPTLHDIDTADDLRHFPDYPHA